MYNRNQARWVNFLNFIQKKKRRVTYGHSLPMRVCFAKFECAFSALPLFYFLFRFKNHHCMVLYIRKALKNQKRLVASRYSLRSARFAKYNFLNLHILNFRCFIPRLNGNLATLDMFISVHDYSFRFVSFRFAKYSKPTGLGLLYFAKKILAF